MIYASSTPTARVAFWDHLSVLSVSIIGPWSLLGQFNEIISPSKVVGGSFHASKAILMINMMTSYGLLYMETMGGSFTWRKDTQNGGHIRQKLDRVLVNPKWHISFPQALVETLPLHNFGQLPTNFHAIFQCCATPFILHFPFTNTNTIPSLSNVALPNARFSTLFPRLPQDT